MFKIFKEEVDFGGKKLILETGKIARQAAGAIIVTCGETVVISTVVGAKKVNPETDYFPLQVNYQEKYYAAGKIPGGYFKREARPTESETLISRLIDRPIRPLFPENFRNEVQILPTVLSYDNENEADILSIIASSAALAISGMPFQGPIAASRVGYINDQYVLNPSKEQLKESKLDLVVAGTKDAVLMVESEASVLTEKLMLDAVKFGHEKFVPVIKAIESLVKKCGKEAWEVEEKDYTDLKSKISKELTKDLEKAFSEKDKKKRSEMITLATEKCKSLFEGDETYSEFINSMVEKIEIQNHFTLLNQEIGFRSISNVDCVFSDFDRSVNTIEKLMTWALSSINDYSSIFIDGLGNYPEGFYYTKLLVNKLNENNTPNFLSMHKKFIEEHNFSLTTIRRQDKNNTGQGSMSWIKIEPNNI